MSFSTTILGSSSALPTSSRFPTAQVLKVHEHFFLIDCGEGTQIQLRKFKIPFNKIDHIFISHLHGDHYFGLFGLLSSFNLLGRKHPLAIYGDPRLKKIIDFHLSYNEEPLNYQINFVSLGTARSKTVFENKVVEIISFPLKHRIPTCGFLFKEKPQQLKIIKESILEYDLTIEEIKKIKEGKDHILKDGSVVPNSKLSIPAKKTRSFAFCSDTKYSETIVKYINDVDLLYHEATFLNNMKDRARTTWHSTATDAANIALKANAKQLMLGHFSARYKEFDEFQKEAEKIFPNVIIAEDGLVVEV